MPSSTNWSLWLAPPILSPTCCNRWIKTSTTARFSRGIKNILLVGICTLVASRLFGMEGLLILAAATVVAPIPGSALIAGLFWSSRALLQSYVSQFNPNVTGVNLMHNYASAALYAGFLVIILAAC